MIQIDLLNQNPKDQEDIYIQYSKEIIAVLKTKTKDHNSISLNKVYLNNLKSVYISGASEKSDKYSCNLLGLARVNMYLRMLNEIGWVSEAKIKLNNKKGLDLSLLFNPIEKDIAMAKEDIKKYNINFDFKDVSNLYLDENSQFCEFYKKFLE